MKIPVTAQTISPLHIGSGTMLIAPFDYLSKEKRTLVLNQEADLRI